MRDKDLAIICNNKEEFDIAQKILLKDSHIYWDSCTGYGNQRKGISKAGWCGENWFIEHKYTIIEYVDWYNSVYPPKIINNYQIY